MSIKTNIELSEYLTNTLNQYVYDGELLYLKYNNTLIPLGRVTNYEHSTGTAQYFDETKIIIKATLPIIRQNGKTS